MMRVPFIELKRQYLARREAIDAAVGRVLDSGWYILGEEGRAFEQEFAAYLGAAHAVGCNSGTDVIALALRAVGVGADSEVVTAANTCVPTVAAIASTGAKSVPADVDPTYLTLTAESVAARITGKTAAIVPVHLHRHPCDMDPILEVARAHGIPVVEDCAQAHGARYKDRPCGTLGDAAAFSFYPTKNLGALGDAGCVVTHDEGLAGRARRMRNYGQSDRYHHDIAGINSRMDELQAAVLRAKLPQLDADNAARRAHAASYNAALAGLGLLLPASAPWATPNHHIFAVRAPQRDALQAHLRQHGIGTLIHYPIPFHLQPAYAHPGYGEGACPTAEKACREVLSLPIYPELTVTERQAVIAAVEVFAKGA